MKQEELIETIAPKDSENDNSMTTFTNNKTSHIKGESFKSVVSNQTSDTVDSINQPSLLPQLKPTRSSVQNSMTNFQEIIESDAENEDLNQQEDELVASNSSSDYR